MDRDAPEWYKNLLQVVDHVSTFLTSCFHSPKHEVLNEWLVQFYLGGLYAAAPNFRDISTPTPLVQFYAGEYQWDMNVSLHGGRPLQQLKSYEYMNVAYLLFFVLLLCHYYLQYLFCINWILMTKPTEKNSLIKRILLFCRDDHRRHYGYPCVFFNGNETVMSTFSCESAPKLVAMKMEKYVQDDICIIHWLCPGWWF